jgi:hypothetical protein
MPELLDNTVDAIVEYIIQSQLVEFSDGTKLDLTNLINSFGITSVWNNVLIAGQTNADVVTIFGSAEEMLTNISIEHATSNKDTIITELLTLAKPLKDSTNTYFTGQTDGNLFSSFVNLVYTASKTTAVAKLNTSASNTIKSFDFSNPSIYVANNVKIPTSLVSGTVIGQFLFDYYVNASSAVATVRTYYNSSVATASIGTAATYPDTLTNIIATINATKQTVYEHFKTVASSTSAAILNAAGFTWGQQLYNKDHLTQLVSEYGLVLSDITTFLANVQSGVGLVATSTITNVISNAVLMGSNSLSTSYVLFHVLNTLGYSSSTLLADSSIVDLLKTSSYTSASVYNNIIKDFDTIFNDAIKNSSLLTRLQGFSSTDVTTLTAAFLQSTDSVLDAYKAIVNKTSQLEKITDNTFTKPTGMTTDTFHRVKLIAKLVHVDSSGKGAFSNSTLLSGFGNPEWTIAELLSARFASSISNLTDDDLTIANLIASAFDIFTATDGTMSVVAQFTNSSNKFSDYTKLDTLGVFGTSITLKNLKSKVLNILAGGNSITTLKLLLSMETSLTEDAAWSFLNAQIGGYGFETVMTNLTAGAWSFYKSPTYLYIKNKGLNVSDAIQLMSLAKTNSTVNAAIKTALDTLKSEDSTTSNTFYADFMANAIKIDNNEYLDLIYNWLDSSNNTTRASNLYTIMSGDKSSTTTNTTSVSIYGNITYSTPLYKGILNKIGLTTIIENTNFKNGIVKYAVPAFTLSSGTISDYNSAFQNWIINFTDINSIKLFANNGFPGDLLITYIRSVEVYDMSTGYVLPSTNNKKVFYFPIKDIQTAYNISDEEVVKLLENAGYIQSM